MCIPDLLGIFHWSFTHSSSAVYINRRWGSLKQQPNDHDQLCRNLLWRAWDRSGENEGLCLATWFT